MATEQSASVTTGSESLGKWGSWLAGLVGLWMLVSPFVLTGAIESGTPMWSNVVSGAIVVLLSAYGGYALRTKAESSADTTHEWSAWIAGLVGLWVLVTPFVLTGAIGTGTVMWSNVAAGIVILALDAYAGFGIHSA